MSVRRQSCNCDRRRGRRKVSLFMSSCLFVMAMTLAAEAAPLKRPLAFQHFTQKEGISGEMVNAITVQGEDVWFGTYAGGATLFDRSKKAWKAYTTKGEPLAGTDDGDSIRWKNLLPYNHVSVILPDSDRIWFGTYFYGFGGGGISYYQPLRKPAWKAFNTNNGVAKKVVSMALDGERLWVGSEKGLSVLDRKTEQWKAFYSAEKGLSGNFVNALLDQADALWAGTNGGISRFDKAKRSWRTYASKEGVNDGEIKALAKSRQRVWAGSSSGALYEHDPAADRWKKIEPTDPLKGAGIYSILGTQERVFVCRDSGVSVCDLATGQWESITTADGLLSSLVFCAAEDKGEIWFGTDRGASRLMMKP